MLFRKKMQRACAYCIYSGVVDEENMICKKCGIVPSTHHCRRFRYDPLKRIPPKPKAKECDQFQNADFSL